MELSLRHRRRFFKFQTFVYYEMLKQQKYNYRSCSPTTFITTAAPSTTTTVAAPPPISSSAPVGSPRALTPGAPTPNAPPHLVHQVHLVILENEPVLKHHQPPLKRKRHKRLKIIKIFCNS
jgi:hypothetical protein